MTKVTYVVGNEKHTNLAEARSHAERTGLKMTTVYEPIAEKVHMTEKQKTIRPRV